MDEAAATADVEDEIRPEDEGAGAFEVDDEEDAGDDDAAAAAAVDDGGVTALELADVVILFVA